MHVVGWGANYQAHNFMRDMHLGDAVFFYHLNCAEPGIVDIMRIAREAYPDPTQFDRCDPHYDPRSTGETPCWSAMNPEFVERFDATVALSKLRAVTTLKTPRILQRGNQLSVTPVANKHWERICTLARKKTSKKAHKNK
jgi:predicted RNA-binding protein with PUA-like domain